MFAELGTPPFEDGVAVALTVTVEVPVGVVKAVVPPQPDSPAREPSSRQTAAHCITNRRLAFLLLASPNRLKASKRPLHQEIPVGVITGD